MKAIVYAGILSAAALFAMSCNANTSEQTPPKPPVEDDYSDITIFEVQAKDNIETSEENAIWRTCEDKQNVASPNYIKNYIFKFGRFIAKPEFRFSYPDNVTHENYLGWMNSPPLMTDRDWVADKFNNSTIKISFYSVVEERVNVSEYNPNNGESCRTFRKIAKQNNDIGYNDYHYHSVPSYSYIPTECVNIECEQNYDAAHPAGTLLNDIATVEYYSAEPFIRSGYKNIRASDVCWFACCDGVPQEPLNDFNARQRNMIANLAFSVNLTVGPAVEGVYTFKLTYKDISGEVRTATTIPIRLASR